MIQSLFVEDFLIQDVEESDLCEGEKRMKRAEGGLRVLFPGLLQAEQLN